MYHDLPRDASFWSFLFQVDQDLANATRDKACPCGGRLHSANYPRKPRGGGDDLPESYGRRLSFCCSRDGCRKRTTPPSVRFLGRKVYLATVVVLVAAMRQGPTPRRVRELTSQFGVDRRTIVRWQQFWREYLPETSFWKACRGRLPLTVDASLLPRSLLQAFWGTDLNVGDPHDGWKRLLLFLAPITINEGRVSETNR
jgi:hypothetical protein